MSRSELRPGLLIGGGVFAFLALAYLLGFLAPVRLGATDILFVDQRPSDHIVIAAIDDASLAAHGRSPTDWPREIYARLVTLLSSAGARVIAIDLLLAEPAAGDRALADAITAARTSDQRTRFVTAAAGVGPARPARSLNDIPGVKFATDLNPVADIAAAVDYVGYANALPEIDGVVRRDLSFVIQDDHIAPTFTIAAYLAYLRLPASAWEQVIRAEADTLYLTDDRRLVIDSLGRWRQDFAAAQGAGFPVLSVTAILDGSADLTMVADKVVLVGLYGATGAVDTYRVPVSTGGREMPGVEIQAHALETLINDRALQSQSTASVLAMIALLALASALAYDRLRWYWNPLALLLVISTFFLFVSVTLTTQRLVISLFDGVLALTLPAFISLGVDITREFRQRRAAEAQAKIARQDKALVEEIVMGSPAATAILDRSGAVLRVNTAYTRLWAGRPHDEAWRLLADRLANAGLDDAVVARVRAALNAGLDFETDIDLPGKSLRLHANMLPLVNQWVAVLDDVTALTELNRMKRQLLLMVSHDLRNPLTSVLIQANLLRKQVEPLGERAVKMAASIEEGGKLMQYILADTLDLEQIRALTFPAVPLGLEGVLRAVLTRYQEDIARKNLTVVQQIAPDLPSISGHEGQMSQVIANLVSNAVKYTPAGGTITLRLSQSETGRVRLEVQDTGIGIPKAEKDKIFKEFYRVKTRATSDIPGTGLGLSIVRTVVEKYGGRVWFESEEGAGTTFFVEFDAAA